MWQEEICSILLQGIVGKISWFDIALDRYLYKVTQQKKRQGYFRISQSVALSMKQRVDDELRVDR